MALNDIIFIKGQGGLGRPLEGEDYISGLQIYTSSVPMIATPVFLGSLADAEKLGITNDYSDAVSEVDLFIVDAIGADGDTSTITVSTIDSLGLPVTYTLATYTQVSGDNTPSLVASAIASLINDSSYTTGYTAEADGDGVLISSPKRLGLYGNSFGVSNMGSIIVVFDGIDTAATFSKMAVWHYHISEFFRVQPKGELYLHFSNSTTWDFSELQTLQDFSGGKIRQVGVLAYERTFSAGDTSAIQTVCNTLASQHKPMSVILSENMIGSVLTNLADLNAYSNNNVSVIIGQDGAGQGNYLFITNSQTNSIGMIGATLGAVSLSKVSEDIAWVSKYNMSNGIELDTINFADGTPIKTTAQNLLNKLDNQRYIFLIKYVGIAGSYFNDSHCAVTVTSDYAYIENNRTIDKAIRGVYSSMLPNLNSPLVLNADGTLTDTTVAYFTSQASTNLDQMVRDVELSAYGVTIDPRQNVLSTSTLVITIKLVPIGVARNIIVNIGFTLSI
jgi:hypothetical protein